MDQARFDYVNQGTNMSSWEDQISKNNLSTRNKTNFLSYFWDVNPLFKKSKEGVGSFLRQISVLKNFSDWEIFTLSKFFHIRNFAKNEPVFSEGEFGLGFYLIFAGNVAINAQINSQDMEIASLEKGDFFGEMALLEKDGKRNATAIAKDDSIMLALFQPDLSEITERYPLIAAKFYQTMGIIIADRLNRLSTETRSIKRELLKIKEATDESK